MITNNSDLEKEYEDLLDQLKQIGEFRRGSINIQFRKCGKKQCACNQEGHPGHGPRTTLTFKEDGKTRTINLNNPVAVEIAQTQINNHQLFNDWCVKWRELNEKTSNQQLEMALSTGNLTPISQEKKQKSISLKKSDTKSKD